MLRGLIRALDRRRRVAAAAAVVAFALALALLPSPPLASTASARIVLRPESPWPPGRAADLLLSDDVLGPASGLPAEQLPAYRSLLRVSTEPHALRLDSTASLASTAAGRVNAVARAFAERAPDLLRTDLEAELARVRASIQERSTDLAALPAPAPDRPDPATEAATLRELDREIQRLTAALEKGETGPPAPVDTSESDRLAAEMDAARRRLAGLRAVYPEDWPPVVQAAADLEDLRLRRLRALNRETLEARFAPVRESIDRLRALSAERGRLAGAVELRGAPAPAAGPPGVPDIRRASLREHLRALEERRADLMTRIGAAEAVIERVEPAARASQSRSSLPLLVLLALLAGAAAALIAERLTTTLRTEHDVRRHVNLPLLGVIPRAATPEDRLVLHATPASRLVEPFNTAAALLEGRPAETKAKLIGVTSARPGEGKSTVAANLAISLARGLARVLLLDADLRRPSQHRIFELGEAQGLSSYLSGAANGFDAVLATTEMENLTVLPAGSPLQNPIPFLRSERLRVAVPELKERFDFVIVDLPPVRSAADALVLAPMLDGLVLVLAAGETGKDDAAAAKRLIRDAHGNLIGCVLNKAEVYSRGYYEYLPAPAVDAG